MPEMAVFLLGLYSRSELPLNLLHRCIILGRPGHHKKILLNLSEVREGAKIVAHADAQYCEEVIHSIKKQTKGGSIKKGYCARLRRGFL